VTVLVSLAVRDFVLIDGLTLELGEGLNVLSGETGAGKSILVDALSLVLGGRARPEVVRTGRDAAEVEALFDLRKAPAARQRLIESGLLDEGDAGDELVVRRSVGAAGRSRAWINGRLVTAAQLGALTRGLCDVSSQHESQTLCDPSTHADLLDAYANLGDKRRALSDEVSALLEVQKEIAAVRARADALRAREDFLRFQLTEIDELDPKPGEEKELEATRTRLRHADRLATATKRAADRLEQGDDTILDALRRVSADVSLAAELDESLGVQLRALQSASAELFEVARALARYGAEVEADPNRLSQLEERLFKLQRVLRKHGPTTEEVLTRRAEIAQELASLDGVDTTIESLSAKRRTLLDAAVKKARALSKARREAAQTLGDKIAAELSSLAMGRARIVVEVASVMMKGQETASSTSQSAESDEPAETEEALAVELEGGGRARLTRTGIDRVELMIAPNPGEDPRPLRRIASGGELSRALLAVKRVLARTGPAGIYVFDEVDAGVGGAVAEAIGRKIADVAKHHQVLCITHLPQIAAFADVHFAVEKREEAGRTVSEVRRVEGKARIDEIARMRGGASITKATRAAADEMIRSARPTTTASATAARRPPGDATRAPR
jgi:DNA repair protein RecN (Recombination protein N)